MIVVQIGTNMGSWEIYKDGSAGPVKQDDGQVESDSCLKFVKENKDKILGENYLTARIDNILSTQNENYDYNTIIKIKFIHINEYCKKDNLFLQFFKK